jgi:hypothetical protein
MSFGHWFNDDRYRGVRPRYISFQSVFVTKIRTPAGKQKPRNCLGDRGLMT